MVTARNGRIPIDDKCYVVLGPLDMVSEGVVLNGLTTRSVIEIGGEVIQKLRHDALVGSYLMLGDCTGIAVLRGIVIAVRLADGRVVSVDRPASTGHWTSKVILGAVIALPCIFLTAATKSTALGWIAWIIAMALVLNYDKGKLKDAQEMFDRAIGALRSGAESPQIA